MTAAKRTVRVVAAQIERGDRYLITQRRPTASLPLLWEFPGGKVEEGEADEAALMRELKEELDIDCAVRERVLSVEHEYADYIVSLHTYRVELVKGEVKPRKVHDCRWVRADELDQYEFPSADQRSVEALLKD